MKTFETEKHNIPEGATHYGVYGCDTDVYFKKDNGVFLQWHNENWSLSQFAHHKWVKPIPQTNIETPEEKEVEWVNGDECIYMNSKELHKFIGIDPTRNDFCYIRANCSAVNWVEVAKLSKPETPQQREERERLELVNSAMTDIDAEYGDKSDVEGVVLRMIAAGYRRGAL